MARPVKPTRCLLSLMLLVILGGGSRPAVAEDDFDPISGEETERLVGELFHLDPTVPAKLKEPLR